MVQISFSSFNLFITSLVRALSSPVKSWQRNTAQSWHVIVIVRICVCNVLSHPEIKWEPIRNIDMADFSRSSGQGFISLQWESAGCFAATRRQMLPKLCLVTSGPGLPAQSSASDNHYPGDCQHSQDNG